MSNYSDKNHYLYFLNDLNTNILDQENFDLVKELDIIFKKEDEIREILRTSKKGLKVFYSFIKYITDIEKNILSARIFFREREHIFSKNIPDSIRTPNPEKMAQFKINYKFVQWAISNSDVPKRKIIESKLNVIIRTRQRIVEQCMPFIINQARLYQAKTRKFSIDPMEFIQVATEGFLSAIDKFEPPADVKFRGVAFGWMKAKLMSEFTETHLKFSLKEKRALYRANVAMYRLKMTDFDDVYQYVVKQYPNFDKNYLKEIIMASSGTHTTDESSIQNGRILKIEDDFNVEDSASENNENLILKKALNDLSIIEYKSISLKGGLK